MRTLSLAAFVSVALAAPLSPSTAQDAPQAVPAAAPQRVDPRAIAQREQERFENHRRRNLPGFRGRRPRDCQEVVGRFCYWYDEDSPEPAPEPATIIEARHYLIDVLDSLGRENPADNWIAGQRVRYLNESGRNAEALVVARECEAYGWWCDALEGYALHALGRYVESEEAYGRVLAAMRPRERCDWVSLVPHLDDDTRQVYNRHTCGEPEREAFEARVWWLSRTRYAMPGNDSRTEHFARHTYVQFLRDAPSTFTFGFDESEREVVLRFGWPVAWSRGPDNPVRPGDPESARISVVTHESTPAYRFIPPYYVIASPAVSDSIYWAVQHPPVVARYSPPYARKLLMLEHQMAIFRRGDTALVVLAYDVSKVAALKSNRDSTAASTRDSADTTSRDAGGLDERASELQAALVLTPGENGETIRAFSTIVNDAPARGTLTARAPWGPLLMSAEVEAESRSVLVRARYGIHPPYGVGARVELSDLLFYTPYGDFPTSVEEALPHAIHTQKVRSGEPLGVFWEAYDTDPAGEQMTITLTVTPDSDQETSWLGRLGRRLGMGDDVSPVTLGVQEMSARGRTVSPRALELNISTLKAGEYRVRLEVEVKGQYVIRAERRLVVTGP